MISLIRRIQQFPPFGGRTAVIVISRRFRPRHWETTFSPGFEELNSSPDQAIAARFIGRYIHADTGNETGQLLMEVLIFIDMVNDPPLDPRINNRTRYLSGAQKCSKNSAVYLRPNLITGAAFMDFRRKIFYV